jgi:hypothetical protein
MSTATPDPTVITLRLTAPPGASPDEVAEAVRRALGPGYTDVRPVPSASPRPPAEPLAARPRFRSRMSAFLSGVGSVLVLFPLRRRELPPCDPDPRQELGDAWREVP